MSAVAQPVSSKKCSVQGLCTRREAARGERAVDGPNITRGVDTDVDRGHRLDRYFGPQICRAIEAAQASRIGDVNLAVVGEQIDPNHLRLCGARMSLERSRRVELDRVERSDDVQHVR